MARELGIVLFFVCWAAIAIASVLLFQFNKNASLKKRLLPWFHLFADAVFVGFLGWLGAPLPAFLLVIPALMLITALNVWGTKFCPHCGRTSFHAYRARFCTRCGRPLDSAI